MKSMVELSHDFLKPALHAQAIVVDATLGNGRDTQFFLSQNVRKVYAFEIQEDVVAKTMETIQDERCVPFVMGHEHMDVIQETVDAIIFNFGYCPHGDTNITTLPETSLVAVQKGLSILKPKGRMVLVFYPHATGQEEARIILDYLSGTSHSIVKVERLNVSGPFFIGIEVKCGIFK